MLAIGSVYTIGRNGYPLFGLITILTSLFLCGEIVSICYFGMKITGDMLMMILGSSPGEMNSFGMQLLVKPLFWVSVVLFLASIFFVSYLIKVSRNSHIVESIKSRLVGLMFLVCALFLIFSFRNPFSWTTHFPFYVQCFEKYKDYSALATFIKHDREMRPTDVRRKFIGMDAPFICIVIGESATREAWSLYGYHRETTPEMEKIKNELIVYKKVKACSSHTTDVMRYLLTCATPEHPSNLQYTLPTLLSCCGYSVSLYSNQEHWGQFDGPISMLFHACSPKVYIKHDVPQSELSRATAYDDDLLQYLKREVLSNSMKPAVIFLHLSGSHIAWRDRAPTEYHKYPQAELAIHDTQETLRNSYDNSIFFTDAILGKAIACLKNTGRPACLFYLSDHGDSPSSGKSRDASSPETWNVPAILWMSSSFKECNKNIWDKEKEREDKETRSDAFFNIIQELCGVEKINRMEKQVK